MGSLCFFNYAVRPAAFGERPLEIHEGCVFAHLVAEKSMRLQARHLLVAASRGKGCIVAEAFHEGIVFAQLVAEKARY